MNVLVSAEALRKQFGLNVAVENANIELRSGRIHGVIGKNGAGKSVLMNMIAGVFSPNGGSLAVRGTAVDIDRWDPRAATAAGIALIPQEPPRLPFLTVEDYLFLGNRKSYNFGLVNGRYRSAKIRQIDEALGLAVHRNDQMVNLPIEVQQMLAFGKAVYLDEASVILLDEITASLSTVRRDALLQELTQLQKDRAFVLITHRINEVMSTCDVVTVMRDGESVKTIDVTKTSANALAREIVGNQQIDTSSVFSKRVAGETLLSVSDGDAVVLTVHRQEVVGLAGLDGSGKDDVIEVAAGVSAPSHLTASLTSGSKIRSSRQAAANGVAYLPKKREEFATIQGMSVLENMVLPIARTVSSPRGLWLNRQLRPLVNPLIDSLNISPPQPSALITSLSGGNRQKVMIGRLRLMKPDVYLLAEPTRGVDIGTKPLILETIRGVLAEKAGVVMTSESEEELVDYCDRIVVFFRGRVVKVLARGDREFTVDGIYRLSQGVTT
jgi:ABC-type sugar transport system ATPase subunit